MVVIQGVAIDPSAGEVLALIVAEALVAVHAELLSWLAGFRRLLLDTRSVLLFVT